jgi:phosphatidylglycerophosphate synthase
MSKVSPTISDLRHSVYKERSREIGNWMARRIARPTAVYGCWLAIRLGLSAHQVTAAALVCATLAAVAIATGSRYLFIAGVLLAHLGFWLDHVDGQVARWRGTVSLDGVYFDYVMHHVINLLLGFALGYGLAADSGDARWAIAGFAISVGWTLLSLHNDCRYKAFFQRLKSAGGSYRVDSGRGERPAPPAPWPRRGNAAFTWPLYKACEYHVVLCGVSALALLAIANPSAWLLLWRGYVLAMALLAPLLAIGRLARSVLRRTAENDFSRWFQPIEAEPGHEPVARKAGSSSH